MAGFVGGGTSEWTIKNGALVPVDNDSIGDGTQNLDVAGIDADSVSTDELSSNINGNQYQAAIGGLVVPVAPGVGVGDAIDPTSTTTPVQDALDAANTAAGTDAGEIATGAILPPDVEEQSSILPHKRQALVPASGGMRIRFTEAGSDGIDLSNCSTHFGWTGLLHLTGPGTGAGTAFLGGTGNTRNVVGDSLFVENFHGGTAIDGSNMFQVNIGHIDCFRLDPGSEWIIDNFPGTGSSIGTIGIYGSDSNSGTDAKGIRMGGGVHRVGVLNMGESLAEGVFMPYDAKCSVSRINYEANQQNTAAPYVLRMESSGLHSVGQIDVSVGDCDYIVDLRQGNGFVGPNWKEIGLLKSGGTVNNSKVGVFSNTNGPNVIFAGESAEVDNQWSSSLAHGVTCLADLVNKTSTGTGP